MRQAVGSRLRGAVPALAGRLGEGLGFRASREEWVCSPSMLASARSRCRWVGFGDRLTNAFGDRLLGYSEVGWAGLFGGLRETVPFWGRQDLQWLHRLQLGAVEALV